jgi:recombination protein RecR
VLPDRLERLIKLLSRLPGVGEKTAQRFAMFFVTENQEYARELGVALAELRDNVRPCERCGNVAELDAERRAICTVCRDQRRDQTLLCIVARVQDLIAIERSGAMRGRYFVLGRLLSPLDGIGPDELPLAELSRLIDADGVSEVIVATPPSVDGEATALLLARELGDKGIRVSRIASGVPHGGELEFADQITLGRAIDGRRAIGSRSGPLAGER